MKKVTLKGIVWGNCWGGDKVGFQSTPVTAKSLKSAIKEAEKMLEDGSLDSGMGFKSLTGATLTATIEDIKEISGKEYINKTYEDVFIGNVEDDEVDMFYEGR